MKKGFLVVLLIVCSLSLAFAQGGNEATGSTGKKVVLKWGSVHADSTITTQMMKRIIATVTEKSGGRIEIQGYPNGALGGSRDLVEGVQTGMVDIITEGPAQFSSQIPMATIAEAPYIWRDVDHMNKALNGPFGEKLNAEFAKVNVQILGGFYYGTRQLTTGKKEVHSVADMKGMKIRVPEVDTYLAMISSWGAKATPLSFNELYLALQQNVVDGQENPLTTFDGSKFYEVQKYVILTQHIICPNMIFMNKTSWDSLSADDQKIISAAVAEGIAWNNEQVIKSEKDLITSLKNKGVTVITPDVDSFRDATVKQLVPQFESKWGKGTWDFIQDIK